MTISNLIYFAEIHEDEKYLHSSTSWVNRGNYFFQDGLKTKDTIVLDSLPNIFV